MENQELFVSQPRPQPQPETDCGGVDEINPRQLVATLLEECPWPAPALAEASVHRPRRGSVYVAYYTGLDGPVSKSTGCRDYQQALAVAKKWEAEAKAERLKRGEPAQHASIRVRSGESSHEFGPMTQQQVAKELRMSVRGVRQAEARAIAKLRRHPLLRKIWDLYLSGELGENQRAQTPEQLWFLLNLTEAITVRS